MSIYRWARQAPTGEGYEVSSRGDKRFSALKAKLPDGRTIEEAYQLDIKGYRTQGNNWRLGKGKKPLREISFEQSWNEYKDLWKQYLQSNPDLLDEIKEIAKTKILTDRFAKTKTNQARAIAEILQEMHTQ